jgi:protein gp37
MAGQYDDKGNYFKHAEWTGQIATLDKHLADPLHWRKPRRVFVNPMSDLFHENVPDEFIWKTFEIMSHNRRHTYMILTKRPSRMRDWFRDYQSRFWHYHAPDAPQREYVSAPWPDPRIWLGITCENQEQADKRIPVLLTIPAAVRFVSAEPLLETIDISEYLKWVCIGCDKEQTAPVCECGDHAYGRLDLLIAGCESGQRRRHVNIDAFRSLRDQCQAAQVPYFLKQIEVDGKLVKMPFIDGRQWKEMP